MVAKKSKIKKPVRSVKKAIMKKVPKVTKKAKVEVAKPTKAGSLSASIFDTKGKVRGRISLPKEIFGAKVNNQLMAQAVRVYLANKHKGTASTKTRGEVHGSTRKIYAQKHTGRARHGSRKAPIFVHGGIVFGPKPHDVSLKLLKKMKRAALFSSLSSKFAQGEIKIVQGIETIEPKTRIMAEILKNLAVYGKDANILLVTYKPQKSLDNIYRASRNLKDVSLLYAALLNAYDVLNNKSIVFLQQAIDVMKDKFLKGADVKE